MAKGRAEKKRLCARSIILLPEPTMGSLRLLALDVRRRWFLDLPLS